MADQKLTELVAATSTQKDDILYLVQGGESKRVSLEVLLGNIVTPTNLNGVVTIGSTNIETLVAPGPVSVTQTVTVMTAAITDSVIVVPAGVEGQIKILSLISTVGGSYSILNNLPVGVASIKFAKVGHTATLMFLQGAWHMIGGTADITYI